MTLVHISCPIRGHTGWKTREYGRGEPDRVAYWPVPVSCDDICVEVSYQGRKLQLLQIDQSERAYDISYDAWNYLSFGKPATEEPHESGGFLMTYEVVHPSTCHHLLNDGKLPLSAANSMNYVASCLVNQPGSWVAPKLCPVQYP